MPPNECIGNMQSHLACLNFKKYQYKKAEELCIDTTGRSSDQF